MGDICEITAKQVDPRIAEFAALPHVNGTSIESGTCRLLHMEAASNAELISGKYLFEPGDVLYSKLRPYLRKVVVAENRGVCSADMYPIRVTRETVDPRFLAWLLATDEFTRYAIEESARARMPKLNREQLFAWETALPPIGEQHRILAVLEGQMAAVERARAAAEGQLEAAKALPAACLKEKFESAEILVWPQRRLGDLMRLRKEVVHPRERPRGRAVFVGLEHIASGIGALIDSAPVEMGELTGRKPRFYEGDIVYGYLRPYLNKVWVAEFDGLCSVDQYVYTVDPREADTRFISAFMRSRVYLARAPVHATPGQLPRIRTEEVASVMINLPPVVEQQRLIGELEIRMAETDRMRRMAEEQVAATNGLPAALLRRAFSGEL